MKRLLNAAEEDATGPLEKMAGIADVHGLAGAAAQGELAPGSQVGAWRIVAPLARGGMSRVFVAERTEGGFLQRAALKLFDAGSDGNDSLARRFEQERQLLAALEDPDIARVLDGGVAPDGRPYLVMELVDGVPIDVHCAERGLSLRERIALVQRAARAVQHAHRNLVVHRDIKPSNILVTAQGAVKLLDFGIAKVLEGSLALGGLDLAAPETRTMARPLTPAYASPEQVRGGPITTASDVYQLGLLAYELVDGHPAHRFEDGSWREFERVVCETDPPRLGRQLAVLTGSTERPARVPSDLETIILKALNKDPERRYVSAEQFAEDLGRFLEDQPVLARPDTSWYRARKFVRRHRLATSALATIGVLVLAGSLLLANLSRRLAAERDRAQLEARKSDAATRFLVGLFRASDPEENLGKEVTAKDLLDRAAIRVDHDLSADPRLQAAMRRDVAQMNLLLARPEVAEPLARRALAAAHEPSSREPGSEARALVLLSAVADVQGRYEEAVRLDQEALASAKRELPGADPLFTRVASDLCDLLRKVDRQDEAESACREAIRRFRSSPESAVSDLADALEGLGLVLVDRGDLRGAETATREGMDLLVQAFGDEDPRTAWARNNLGRILERRGALAEARDLYRVSLAMRRKLYGEGHVSTAVVLHNLARLSGSLGEWDEAVSLNDEACSIRATRLGADHPLTCLTLSNAGLFERERLHLEAALGHLEVAEEHVRRSLGEVHRQTLFTSVQHGLVLLDLDRLAEARTHAGDAERLLAGEAVRDHVPSAILLGRLELAEDRPDQALEHFARAVEAAGTLGEPLYRPKLEAEFLLALERAKRGGERTPSGELTAAAAALRERSPRLRILVDSALEALARS